MNNDPNDHFWSKYVVNKYVKKVSPDTLVVDIRPEDR